MNKEMTSNNPFLYKLILPQDGERSNFWNALLKFYTFKALYGAKFISKLALNPNNLIRLTSAAIWLISEELSKVKEVSSTVPHLLLKHSIVHTLWQWWGISPLVQNVIGFLVGFRLVGHLVTSVHWRLQMVLKTRPFCSNMRAVLMPLHLII